MVVEVSDADTLPQKHPILLRAQRIKQVLGVALDKQQVKEILTGLGMQVTAKGNDWQVVPPLSRFDISIETDLIEEVGRIYGYNNIPTKLPTGELTIAPRSETKLTVLSVQTLLVARGFQEVVTYSFVDPALQQLIEPDCEPIALANPISADMAVMRTSLWPGLLSTIRHNLNRQQERTLLFETGLSFRSVGNDIEQKLKIAGAMAGSVLPEQWGANKQNFDFYDAKSVIEAILSHAGCLEDVQFEASHHSALHPGQSARLIRAGQVIGWLGKLHPEIKRKQELSEDVFLFEIDFMDLQNVPVPAFEPLSKYPSIRRDLAVVVDETVTSSAVCETIKATLPDQLKEVRIFDVYRGKGIESGRKSLALGLILQDSSRTLVDNEVDTAIESVMVRLGKELGASLRD